MKIEPRYLWRGMCHASGMSNILMLGTPPWLRRCCWKRLPAQGSFNTSPWCEAKGMGMALPVQTSNFHKRWILSVLHCPPPNLHGLHVDCWLATDSKWSPSRVLAVHTDSTDSPSGLNLDNLYKWFFITKVICPSPVQALLDLVKFSMFTKKIRCTEHRLNPRCLHTSHMTVECAHSTTWAK